MVSMLCGSLMAEALFGDPDLWNAVHVVPRLTCSTRSPLSANTKAPSLLLTAHQFHSDTDSGPNSASKAGSSSVSNYDRALGILKASKSI